MPFDDTAYTAMNEQSYNQIEQPLSLYEIRTKLGQAKKDDGMLKKQQCGVETHTQAPLH